MDGVSGSGDTGSALCALHIACKLGAEDAARVLLDAGENVNIPTRMYVQHALVMCMHGAAHVIARSVQQRGALAASTCHFEWAPRSVPGAAGA